MKEIKNNTNCINLPLIGQRAPKFNANTTNGPLMFPTDFSGKWIVFFSHPSDFTPVCTTEFIAFQNKMKDFAKINTVLVGLSVGGLASHLGWLNAIAKMKNGADIKFPLIDDLNMNIAKMYGMIHPDSSNSHAVRAVFIIDSDEIVRAIMYYPATLGRNISEIYRMVIGLQTGDAFDVSLPSDWNPGYDVLRKAPLTTKEIQKNKNDKQPWFMNYEKLGKKDIYEKICKNTKKTE